MPDSFTSSEIVEMDRIRGRLDQKARMRPSKLSVTLKLSDWQTVTDQLARLVILTQRCTVAAKEKQEVIVAQQVLIQELTDALQIGPEVAQAVQQRYQI